MKYKEVKYTKLIDQNVMTTVELLKIQKELGIKTNQCKKAYKILVNHQMDKITFERQVQLCKEEQATLISKHFEDLKNNTKYRRQFLLFVYFMFFSVAASCAGYNSIPPLLENGSKIIRYMYPNSERPEKSS